MLELNKETIEDKIFSEKNGNFQTMNMIHKLKKIKKKRKQVENIKKMEFPEVLSNVKKETAETPMEKNTNTIEGFQRFKFEHDDWDGYDNVKDTKGKTSLKDPRQIIIDFINYVYNTIVSYNRKLASNIADKLSNNVKKKENNKNVDNIKVDSNNDNSAGVGVNEKDEELMYKYICLFEAILFSSFVVNNWYYLMFYNNFKDGEKKELFDFSVDRIKNLSDDFLSNKFLKYILLYFIEYALFFPDKLQYFIIDIVPGFSSRFLNHTLCYILLFLFILYISYYFASGFKNFLIDVINVNYKNFLVCLMYITVIIIFFIPEVKPSLNGGAEGSNGNASTTVFKIIWNFIRFLIIISISLPLGGFFCLLYFSFYSLYAMLYYYDWDVWKLSEMFKDVLSFIDNKKISIIETEDSSLFEMIIIKINQYLEYLSDNFFVIVFLIAFIYSLADSLKNITNNTLRSSLYFIDISFIFMIIIFLLYLIKAKFNITSFTDAIDVLKNINNKTPIEKNYDSSANIFYFVNLANYGLSLGVIGYLIITFIGYNNSK